MTARSPSPSGSRSWDALAAASLVLVTLLAYRPAFDADYVAFDDDTGVVACAPHLGFAPEQLRWMATSFRQGHWQPAAWASLALDRLAFGDDPRGHHAVNVALHAVSALLFLGLARRLLAAGARPARSAAADDRDVEAPFVGPAALFAALLFAVHPLRVEAVAWITERRLLLATLFLLLALRAYVAPTRDAGRTGGPAFRPRSGRVLAFTTLSLLCTTWAATLPALLLVLDVYPLRRWDATRTEPRARRALLLGKLALALPCGAALAVAALAQGASGATASLASHDPLARLLQAGWGLLFQPWKTLVPTGLVPLYPLRALDASDVRWWIAPALALLVTIACVALRRRAPAALAAWCAYAVLVSPVLGLLQSGPQLTADRYAYVPGLALATLAGAGLLVGARRLAARRGARTARGALVAASCAYALVAVPLTAAQTAHWTGSLELWTHALAAGPETYVAHANLARALRDAGRTDEAIEHWRAARRMPPPDRDGRNQLDLDLAGTLANLGRVAEAEPLWRDILARDPRHVAALVSLGLAASTRGEQAEAAGWWRRALDAWEAKGRPEDDAALVAQVRGWIDEDAAAR